MRWLAVVLLIAACGSTAPATQSGWAPFPGASFQLNVAPGDLGCDTIGVPYRQVMFKIDPTASDPVTALTDTGTTLRTFWSAGFQGSAADKTVLDPSGVVVAADGEILMIPEGAFPRLRGYFVCPSTDAVYVLSADPS
jgi:hypothetical protein